VAHWVFHGPAKVILMSHRFFVGQAIQSDQVELDGPEAHHLLHVLRASIGQQVTLLDGSGFEFLARITAHDRRRAQLEVVERVQADRELAWELVVGVALPKGDRQRWLVEKAVELGTTRMVPLVTERGVNRPSSSALARLRRTVVEASKQCGRNVLMDFDAAQPLQNFLNDAPKSGLRIVAHPSGPAAPSSGLQLPVRPPGEPIFIAIGPEGGFTDTEWQQACESGWQSVDLGPRILRIETAALALVAALTLT